MTSTEKMMTREQIMDGVAAVVNNACNRYVSKDLAYAYALGYMQSAMTELMVDLVDAGKTDLVAKHLGIFQTAAVATQISPLTSN